MFETIVEIRDYGIFDHFAPDLESLPNFAERNLIYGWNYAGKTTLSRVFRSFERERQHADFEEGRFALKLSDGTRITQRNLDQLPFAIRVFNTDYVRENLRWEDGVAPILVLGEQSIKLQEESKRLGRWITRRERYIEELGARADEIRDELNRLASQAAQRVREEVRRTPFNRAPHLEAVVDEVKDSPAKHLLTEENRGSELQRLNAEARSRLNTIQPAPSVETLVDRVSDVIRRTATQEVLDRLRDDPDIERWVEAGREFHENATHCRFCTNELPKGLLEELGRHFSTEFQALRQELNRCVDEVNSHRATPTPPDKAAIYPDLQDVFERASQRLYESLERDSEQLNAVKETLQAKSSRMHEVFELQTDAAECRTALNAAIRELNSVVELHNERCDNLAEEKRRAEDALIRHEAAAFVDRARYYERLSEVESLRAREERWKERVGKLRAREKDVLSEISEAVRGADVINEYLSHYFGTSNVTVVLEQDTGKYSLRRDGHRANNLSEGERTAIAFSYFMASLQHQEIRDEKPVLYIDDPVSSLDSNHLFSVFSTIKAATSTCRQLFVATHNFELFRLMKGDSFFRERVRQNKRASWYLLRRRDANGSELVDLPMVLRKFNSEYHYLFYLVLTFVEEPESYDHLSGMIPNTLRRMLEVYTSFKVPQGGLNLAQRLKELILDPGERHQLYKFVNHGSHSDSLTLAVEFPQSAECLKIAKQGLDFVRATDPEHYEGMEAAVRQ